ncbi:unnamed protein product [Notodromas monacha]|uniref:Uncharacterized protein n=1 Tax=Notodromas monacha TaxID=399045 RepID=A0A7R9GK13_9CRUS|nr:unnamed protein product [Notodromas monacha]CAG0924144.1 unnamed protein product [Notodromas monacha]
MATSSYSLGKISYYEPEPGFRSYQKRVADEPYRTLRQSFYPPVDDFVGSAVMREDDDVIDGDELQQELLEELAPLLQKAAENNYNQQQSLQQKEPESPDQVNELLDPGYVPDADAAAFLEYLANNENHWGNNFDYDQQSFPETPAKSVNAAIVEKNSLKKVMPEPFPITRQKTASKPDKESIKTQPMKSTTAPTTVEVTKTTATTATQTTPMPSVEPSVMEAVKQFLLQKRNHEIGQKQRPTKRFITEPQTLLRQRTVIDSLA